MNDEDLLNTQEYNEDEQDDEIFSSSESIVITTDEIKLVKKMLQSN